MNGPKTHRLSFCRTMGEPPRPVWQSAKRQVLQMVLDIAGCRQRFA